MNALASVMCVVSVNFCIIGSTVGIGVAAPFSAVGAFISR